MILACFLHLPLYLDMPIHSLGVTIKSVKIATFTTIL